MFDIVNTFESTISDFYKAPYAVAVDCCTHAIELCIRLQKIQSASCPKHTYLSVPMTLEKLNMKWEWNDEEWSDFYYLKGTNIIDAAVYWKENSYIPGTMMCLSFQFRKHLNLGRGGMILLDNKEDYENLICMSYDGRSRAVPWIEQDVSSMGYHYYMTPETAQLGLEKFQIIKDLEPKKWNYTSYPDLSKLPVFNR
jgi:dTDP-4-amino-4,6-dideoxygalactose transaminase